MYFFIGLFTLLLTTHSFAETPAEIEKQLITSLASIQSAKLDDALTDIANLAATQPDFKLAQLIYADMLLAQANPLNAFGGLASTATSDITGLQQEAQARWQGQTAKPSNEIHIPDILWQVSHPHIVVVDVTQSRLFLFKNVNNQLTLQTDYYVSIGKQGYEKFKEGDQRTPLGVYFVVKHIPDQQLPKRYGVGALTLDYPNVWDKHLGKTGFGIWLHGTHFNTYSRPPLDSDGCVVLTNPDFNAFEEYITPGETPVIIAEKINWLTPDQVVTARHALSTRIESWRHAWEQSNQEAFLAHYAPKLRAHHQQGQLWKVSQSTSSLANTEPSSAQFTLSNLNIFRYPNEPELAVVTFTQRYRTDQLDKQRKQQQYWYQHNDEWVIVLEKSWPYQSL